MKDRTGAERQSRYRASLKKNGLVEVKLIVPIAFREDLKARANEKELTVSELVMVTFGH